MKIDYNDIMKFKIEIENLYPYLQNAHSKILKLLEEAECLDDEKIDTFYSYIKEYESRINVIKADFLYLESENKKLESCMSQVRLLKKRRLTKIESNINSKNSSWDGDPFEDYDIDEDHPF